ncbi:unnamed protein product, partial [Strongylus vulgaris]
MDSLMLSVSRLAFRKLVRLYDVDCCYTPMIYAKNFLESEHCRSSEFSTTPDDRPLIVQFASSDPIIFGSAAELVYKYATGVDLNCGCPKSDVRAKGFGSFLLNQPELLADIVKQCRARISDPDFTVIMIPLLFAFLMQSIFTIPKLIWILNFGESWLISLKIRIQYPLEKTVDLCRKAENAGVSHLTVHGRTPQMRYEAVDYDAIRIVKVSYLRKRITE